jgi:hypothetical protein
LVELKVEQMVEMKVGEMDYTTTFLKVYNLAVM